MKNTFTRIGLGIAAGLTALVVAAPPVAAQPSCVAQSIQAEHELYGSSWGRQLIAFLASHPEVLQEFGFSNFGELAKYATSQDPAACPVDL
jgi:hypothetical protein